MSVCVTFLVHFRLPFLLVDAQILSPESSLVVIVAKLESEGRRSGTPLFKDNKFVGRTLWNNIFGTVRLYPLTPISKNLMSCLDLLPVDRVTFVSSQSNSRTSINYCLVSYLYYIIGILSCHPLDLFRILSTEVFDSRKRFKK